jgi:magnesium-transporting ATPase (P-type)
MTLAYLNVSGTEIIFIISYFLLIIWAGDYGRNTVLGYWGTIMIGLFASPLLAFAIVYILKSSSSQLLNRPDENQGQLNK